MFLVPKSTPTMILSCTGLLPADVEDCRASVEEFGVPCVMRRGKLRIGKDGFIFAGSASQLSWNDN